jgi:sugar phosphate isomerase/epimerase
MTAAHAFRLGYNTNGFAHHRLDDALHVIAELGYRAVALTPDANHLPPYHTSDAQLRSTRALLEQLDLAVVVETGARFVLDPRRKHKPTLIDADAAERARRLDFLVRCAEITAALGGDTLSLWSGIRAADLSPDDAWRWLAEGVVTLHERVSPLGVQLAFEPEPGMLVSSLADWERLRDATPLSSLGLTLDVASSSRRIDGSASSARAIATRWRWPPDSFTPRSPTTVSYCSGIRSMNSSQWATRATRFTSASVASGRE